MAAFIPFVILGKHCGTNKHSCSSAAIQLLTLPKEKYDFLDSKDNIRTPGPCSRGHDCQLETIGFEEVIYVLQINIHSHTVLTKMDIKEVFHLNLLRAPWQKCFCYNLKGQSQAISLKWLFPFFLAVKQNCLLDAVCLFGYKRSNRLTFMLFMKKIFGQIIVEHFLQKLIAPNICLAKKGQPNCKSGHCQLQVDPITWSEQRFSCKLFK